MPEHKLSMGRINYINASPVYYGLDNGLLPSWLEMIDGAPSVLNQMIKDKALEISPVSAAFYGMNHKSLQVLPDLSISCNGPVLSVILVSNYPVQSLDKKNVVLTSESATSAALVQLVFARQQIKPNFKTQLIHSIDDIPEGTDAALVIGDVALAVPWERRFGCRFDLGELWHKLTGLPFVFALWVVRRSYAKKNPNSVRQVVDLFYRSREKGYDNIQTVIETGAEKLNLSHSLIQTYYDHLYCDLDEEKVKAVKQFFSSLYNTKIFPEPVDFQIFS
ncbi:MAG: menaquinone biosynthesis protein [Thermodesulfobacteriota bacterium]|nr:menaquinone biosynthesis protein [Thermodesulfobacteriota bacterium]